MFFAPKIGALTDFPASETSRPLATSSLALAHSSLNLPLAWRETKRRFSSREDYPLASLEGDK